MRKFTDEEIKALKEGDEKREAELREELGEELNHMIQDQLTVRQKLFRRQKIRRIKTVLDSESMGEIVLETRMLLPEERRMALEAYSLMDKTMEDVSNYTRALHDMREVCKAIDATEDEDSIGSDEFWDNVSDDIVIAVILNAVYGGISAVGEGIRSFRRNTRRPVNAPVLD